MQNQIQSDAQYSADYDDEIDLRELFTVLWAGPQSRY
jgi:LPS O-antigen subunit length determinant protein (WzzB/FepE family)